MMASESARICPQDAPSDVFAELGPALPSAVSVWQQAWEIRQLAARAMEFSGGGPTHDLALALRQLERMRAILGAGGQA